MNTQEILTRVNAIVTEHNELQRDENVRTLIADLESQIRSEIAKSGGNLNAVKTIERLLKVNKDTNRSVLSYAWIDEEGRQVVCDGYRIFRIAPGKHLPLESMPENLRKNIPDMNMVFPLPLSAKYKPVPLPTVNELKTFIALERAKNGRNKELVWDLGEGCPFVNATYLLDIFAIFPDVTEIFCDTSLNGQFKPVYVRSENGDALLLPIRNTAEKVEQKAAQYYAANNTNAEEVQREKRRRSHNYDLRKAMLAEFNTNAENDPDYAWSEAQVIQYASLLDEED